MAPYYLTNEIIMQIKISNIVTRTIEMNVYVPRPDKEMSRFMFNYNGPRNQNLLPVHIKECNTLQSFKHGLKKYVKSLSL